MRLPRASRALVILFLHNRYRTLGGEERAVGDLAWLVREHLCEPVELLERDSATLAPHAAAGALLRGGEDPEPVAAAVRRTGARIVHAHNLNPSFGPRALLAARGAGAKVVLHLHNYRLVCAVGTCVNSRGEDCISCHGRDTRPGVRLNCRGSRSEAAVYAAALARHSATLVKHADAVVVPSQAAHERLRTLGAPLGATPVHVVGHVVRSLDGPPATPREPGSAPVDTSPFEHGSTSTHPQAPREPDGASTHPQAPREPGFALVVARLAPEKAVDVAIDACLQAGVGLVVAGDGPQRTALEARARGHDVRFVGRVDDAALAELREQAGVAVVTTRAHETFGLAALEAMAAGLPTVATARGALVDLADGVELVAPDDVAALAAAILRVRGSAAAGARAHGTALRLAAPRAVAPRLAAVYESV